MQLALMKDDNTEQQFRDLYYHLYSNSNSSRSERILADVSKLILLSIANRRSNVESHITKFMSSKGDANNDIMPVLRDKYPLAIKLHESFSLDNASLKHSFKLIEDIDLVSSPSHTFGDAFQALMGPRIRGDKGQFFTPRSVVRSLVDIIAPNSSMRVIDPACGTGGFLSAVLDRWGREKAKGTVVGIDKDSDLSLLASALSTVHAESGSVEVHNANSLSLSDLPSIGVDLGTFDCVFTNPPFGSKIGITDRDTLKQFDLGRVWDKSADKSRWTKTDLIRPSQDPQVLFIELCVRLLKEGGQMAIVLPEGIFGNSGSGYVWEYLLSQGNIDALIDCPRTTFQPGTDTKTNILIFSRGKRKSNNRDCWIAVAYSCGHDKRGRSKKADGGLVPDDFALIAKDWSKPADQREIWNKGSLLNNNYFVPRYYDNRLSDDVEQDAKRLRSKVVSLGDLVKAGVISIRKGHEVGSEAYGSGDVPFVRTSDIHNFEISHDPTNCVSEEIYQEYKNQQKLKSGDLLMVVDGRYKIGRCAILHEWTKKCVVQSHLRIISISPNAGFDPVALLYGLALPSVQREIRRLVFIQSTLGSLGPRINEIRLPDPRKSVLWGEAVSRFEDAIIARAEHASYLQSFGHEVEL